MSHDRERTLQEEARRNPFWVCVLVFGVLALDAGLRLSRLWQQRDQMAQAQLTQAANIGRLEPVLSQLPTIEAKLQAVAVDLDRIARTNTTAAQIVNEFNIQWTPGKDAAATAGTNAPAKL
ncbi:MAG: hypothetical protein EXS35_17635 [Pedosphaera sp.]|nr:hypothetical protein [Pedosphaera sp.]